MVNIGDEFDRAGLFTPKKLCPSVGKGTQIDNFATGNSIDIGAITQESKMVLPYRPIPVMVDKYRLNFSTKNNKSQNIKAKEKRGRI